ncbi:MAG: zinc-dependent metalloprotease [Fibrella sp.]|nr:zinc-dependent metalloprotease [Armatimonadota bacterium]
MKISRIAAIAASISLVSLVSGVVHAQTPAPSPSPSPAPAPKGGAPAPPARPAQPPTNKPKPYAEVITKEAKTDDGIIKTHQIDDKVYFEIPKAVYDKPILWVTTFSRIQTGRMPFGLEVQDRVVTWERRGDKVLLRSTDYTMRSKTDDGTRQSLDLLNLQPVLMVFNVAANGPDDAAVIDASPILTTDVNEFSPKRALGVVRLDSARTFIETVKSFPTNVEMNVLATYADANSNSVSAVLHHSLVALPEKPMKPRLEDSRVGFFSTYFSEFGGDKNRVEDVIYINRFRLEKKDPAAALSEPVKPITWYIAPEVPKKWHPYVKAGVEAWNEAFEAAGFKNAIVCKEPPTKEQEPDFDVDDARYSVVRWLPSDILNAYGPSLVDPRSGEILSASPKFFHNILKLQELWYFTQASPNDPKAQKLPLSTETMGPLLQYVVTHEIGHCLGFPHNKKASSSVPVKLLRDPEWTKKWGTEASVMDYGRFNYVAQPTDGVTNLIPKIGPYDIFATEWGYKPLPGDDPESEKASLDAIAQRQVSDPMLRFGHGEESFASQGDPGQRSEDLGSDALEATPLGLKNIDRVLEYIVSATTKPGEDYTYLGEMFDNLVGQRARELSNVAALVGGFTQTDYHYQQGGSEVFTPIPAGKQKQAVAFLMANAFNTPKNILRPDILARIESSGATDRVLQSQLGLLIGLLSESRAKRMVDQELMYKGKQPIYTLTELMSDTRKGLWSELAAPQTVAIDAYRRGLQRQYVQALGTRMTTSTSEMRPLARLTLMDTQVAIKAALPKTTDRATKAHLLDCNQMIQQMLYPTKG